MTPAEKRLRDKLEHRAAMSGADARLRLLRAWDIVRLSLSESDFLAAVNNGTLESFLAEILSDRALEPAFAELRSLIDRSSLESAATWSGDLPIRGAVFNVLNPRVIESVRALDTRVIQTLKAEVRETVRQAALEGLEAGVHPRTVARRVRSVIGLAPNQEAAVANFRRMLEAGDREALTRALRDRRFDRTLQKALGRKGTGLSAEQIDRMTEAYRKRMVAFNAETNARTIALDTQRLAQRNSWQSSIDRGLVDASRLRRTWVSVGDHRVRPEHVKMHGETVRWGERWSNGEDIPGQSTYNCRCLEKVFLVAAPAARVPAARLAA